MLKILDYIDKNIYMFIIVIILLGIILLMLNTSDYEHLTQTQKCCPCPPDGPFVIIRNQYKNKRIGLKTMIDGKTYFLCLLPRDKCPNVTNQSDDCKQNVCVLIEESELTQLKIKYVTSQTKENKKCMSIKKIDCEDENEHFEADSNVDIDADVEDVNTENQIEYDAPDVTDSEEILETMAPQLSIMQKIMQESNKLLSKSPEKLKTKLPVKPKIKLSLKPKIKLPVSPSKGITLSTYLPKETKSGCDYSECKVMLENNFINSFILDVSKTPQEFMLYGSFSIGKNDTRRLLVNAHTSNLNFVCGDTTLRNADIFSSVSFIQASQHDMGGIITSKKKDTYKLRIRSPIYADGKQVLDKNKKPTSTFTYFGTCIEKLCGFGVASKRICLYDDIVDAGVLEFTIVPI